MPVGLQAGAFQSWTGRVPFQVEDLPRRQFPVEGPIGSLDIEEGEIIKAFIDVIEGSLPLALGVFLKDQRHAEPGHTRIPIPLPTTFHDFGMTMTNKMETEKSA